MAMTEGGCDRIWQEPASVALLQWLTRGTLKQNLLQGVRLWVWLHFLYGDAGDALEIGQSFTYAQWRDAFFHPSHPTSEQRPTLHHPDCPCAKFTATWLWGGLTLTQPAWDRQQRLADAQIQDNLEQFTTALTAHGQLPADLTNLLFRQRPFAMTRRTLYGDLRRLTDMSWLRQQGQQFYKVDHWPDSPSSSGATPEQSWVNAERLSFLTQPDLAAIAANFAPLHQGERRFFVHVDYVISRQQLDRVDDWQALLGELWQQSPVPPVRLRYLGAGQTTALDLVVFPVCIYYYRRGPYLCAFGQVPPDPKAPQPEATLGWRNYRLDRIQALQALDWANPDGSIPPALQHRYHHHTLPSPDDIAIAMAQAWGFDYYQPAQLLLLRFDQTWNQRYIRDTLRHITFQPVSYGRAKALIQQHTNGPDQQHLLNIWQARSPDDAYYTATYRTHDPNISQRLRAWRPHVEILLPPTLRQQFATEVKRESQLYNPP
jgi:CRISPR-associated protein (TIGR03985 family)